MQAAGISWLGDLRLPAGEAFVVERVFRSTDGSPIDVTGRQFTLTVFAIRGMAPQLDIAMVVDGPIAAAAITTLQSYALAQAQAAGADLAWQITEQLAGGGIRFAFGPRAFALSLSAIPAGAPLQPGPLTGAPVVQLVAPDAVALVKADALGPPGFSAAQIVHRARPLELPVPTDEAFTEWVEDKVYTLLPDNALRGIPIAATEIDGSEVFLLVKAGVVRTLTFAELVLAITEWRTVGFTNAGQTALDSATGIL